jgi:putative ABC transport system ATP-binding protein
MRSKNRHPARVLQIRDLTKSYQAACHECAVVNGVSLDVHAGEFVVLLGVSGSGKSTLLNLAAGIDQADRGQVIINNTDLTRLREHDRTVFRRDHIGIVFQFFNLIPTLTVLENITLPVELRGTNRRESQRRARALLERVGLADRENDFPDQLSGGEQQRIAIARALIHEPVLVLADEPTGNLDEDTGHSVLALLLELTQGAGRTLLMATHNPEIVPYADRVVRIQDGKLVESERPTRPQPLTVDLSTS